jgi:hypothetical protein
VEKKKKERKFPQKSEIGPGRWKEISLSDFGFGWTRRGQPQPDQRRKGTMFHYREETRRTPVPSRETYNGYDGSALSPFVEVFTRGLALSGVLEDQVSTPALDKEVST